MADSVARIRDAIATRKNPNFLIVARSDAFWVHRDLDDSIARLEAYAAAGADMVFPTLVGPRALAEVRRRVKKPVMVVNTSEELPGASVVLYYAFSIATQFSALKTALEARALVRDTAPLEDFLGYKDASGRSE